MHGTNIKIVQYRVKFPKYYLGLKTIFAILDFLETADVTENFLEYIIQFGKNNMVF